MRNGTAPSMVRVLPAADDQSELSPQSSDPGPNRRTWVLPLVVAASTIMVFVAVTRPTVDPNTEAVTTNAPPLLSAVTAETIDLTTPSAIAATTTKWEEVNFRWPGQIAGNLF